MWSVILWLFAIVFAGYFIFSAIFMVGFVDRERWHPFGLFLFDWIFLVNLLMTMIPFSSGDHMLGSGI
jgi:hypothetical protein